MSTSDLTTDSRSNAGTVELIQFLQGNPKDRKVLHRILGSDTWYACVVESRTADANAIDLELMITEPNVKLDDDPWFDFAKTWCESGIVAPTSKATLISLHGVDVYWCTGRAIVRAPKDRVDAVRRAILEFAVAERELVAIEKSVNSSWDTLEGDVPTAFSYGEGNVRDRAELGKRFQKAISLQARMSRIVPLIVQPAQYPPTLESQLHERMRERLRQEDRLEVLEGQLDIFQRVYEMCGQRSADFMVARTGHILEWIIILLLAFQTIMAIIDYIPSSTTGT